MSGFRRVLRGETEIGFVRNSNRWFRASAVLVGLSILGLVAFNLNFGIDFRGGVSAQAPNPAGATVAEVREAIGELGISQSTIQLIDDGAGVRVQTGFLDAATEAQLIDTIARIAGTTSPEVSVDAVGPTFGNLVARQALIALAVFLVVVALYMTVRLEMKMAAVGLVALMHDLAITVGVYAISGLEVSPATVVAILTILGYSLYDTVVVFDKVEEFEKAMDKSTYGMIVERAMNAVLARSLATSLTSLVPVGSILVVGSFILGAPTLREFALALFIGMAAGTYSSVFLAGPLLARWKSGEEEWQERERRFGKSSAVSS